MKRFATVLVLGALGLSASILAQSPAVKLSFYSSGDVNVKNL
jgi:hypothetical protein